MNRAADVRQTGLKPPPAVVSIVVFTYMQKTAEFALRAEKDQEWKHP